jgi:hypothetical protein
VDPHPKSASVQPVIARAWAPTKLTLVHETMTLNSTAPSRVLFDGGTADASEAFIKTLGNPEGPGALVSEYVGTALAKWLGLETSEMAVFNMPADPQLAYKEGFFSLPGPAFASRYLTGKVWDGLSDDLVELANPGAIAGLVLLDTWTRNNDRFSNRLPPPPRRNTRNVYISWKGGGHRLVALDQSACFGRFVSDSVRRLSRIDEQKDETVFGLFPEFVPYVTPELLRPYVDRLGEFRSTDIAKILHGVPSVWFESQEHSSGLVEFCVARAAFLHQHAEDLLAVACTWHPTLPFPRGDAK